MHRPALSAISGCPARAHLVAPPVNIKQDRLKTDQDDLPIQIVFHGATSLMVFFHGKLALPL